VKEDDMARPLKAGLSYFQHDVDMSADEKLEALEAIHGNDGYAVFNKLLERVYKSFGKLDLSDDVQRLSIARKCNVSSEKFDQIILDAIRFRLFDREPWEQEKRITSERIREQLGTVEAERDKWRKKSGADNPVKGELSPEKTIIIPGENPDYPEGKVHKAEQSRAEYKKSNTAGKQTSSEPTAAPSSEPADETACLPADIKIIQDKIKAAPWPSSFSNRDLVAFALRIRTTGIDAGFVDYCIDRAARDRKTEKPAGLFKLGLLSYNDWLEEYRAKAPPPGTATEYETLAPELRQCQCGSKPKVNRRLGEATCTCGRSWTFNWDWEEWREDAVEKIS